MCTFYVKCLLFLLPGIERVVHYVSLLQSHYIAAMLPQKSLRNCTLDRTWSWIKLP